MGFAARAIGCESALDANSEVLKKRIEKTHRDVLGISGSRKIEAQALVGRGLDMNTAPNLAEIQVQIARVPRS